MRLYVSALQRIVFVLSWCALSAYCFHFRAGIINGAPTLSRRTLSILKYQKHPAYDDNRMYVPPKYVVDAVMERKNQPVTVADVSAASGVGLASVQNDLMQLAQASGGRLQVTKHGQIMYIFPPNFEYTIVRNSLARQVQLIYEKIAPILGFVFRASFGLCLVASLAVITTALVVAMSSRRTSASEKSDDKKKRRREAHDHNYRGPGFVTYIDITDILRLVLRYAQWPRSQVKNNGEEIINHNIGFLESFFSFVFGDGDPNEDFEERASAQAAQMIRQKNGVVSAEQLAPYLRQPPPLLRTSSSFSAAGAIEHDESYVLPLLLRFNGQPGVTPCGNMFYAFPEMMLTGQQQQQQNKKVDPILEEFVPFSRAEPDMQLLAGALAGVNLLGALTLGQIISSSPFSWVRKIYPLLLVYAVTFTAAPLFRFFTGLTENNAIRKRNDSRLKWLRRVEKDPQYLEKLQDITQNGNLMSAKDIDRTQSIVFDTTLSDTF